MDKRKLVKIESSGLGDMDNLYLEIKIIRTLLNLKEIKSFFHKLKVDFKKNIKGYLYLLETCLSRLVHHQENLVRDERLYHLLHYKMYNLNQIKRSLGDNEEIEFMRKTLELRKKLAKYRLEKGVLTGNFSEEIRNLLASIFSYYEKNHVQKKIEPNFILENKKMLLYLGINHLDFMGGTDLDFKTKKTTFHLTIPANIYCVSLNEVENINYSLLSPEIESHNKKYLKGYSLSLIYILKGLGVNKSFLNSLKKAKNWEDIRKIGRMIYREESGEPTSGYYDYPLFIPQTKILFKPLKKKEIKSLEDFIVILKERDVQILDYYSREQQLALFLFLLRGQISLGKKIQLIRFKSERERGWYTSSCFFYIPFGDLGFYNDSHWIFFYNIGLENNTGYKSKFVYLLENYLKKYSKEIVFEDYKVKRDLMLKGVKELYHKQRLLEDRGDSLHRLFNEKEMLKFKEAKSLLIELLSNYLFNKKSIYSEVSIPIKDKRGNTITDIDCLIITSNKIKIIQATSFLYNKDKIKNLGKHFEKIEKALSHIPKIKSHIKNKKVERVLFCLGAGNRTFLTKYLLKNKIKLIEYEDIKKDINKRLRSRINKIFELNDLG